MIKKINLLVLICGLISSFCVVTPAKADRFWPGVAVGVGSAIVLSHLVSPPRPYYYEPVPAGVYGPPPPAHRVGWRYGPYHSQWRYAHPERHHHSHWTRY
ncbi:MAG TPA: hypothetical protein VK564_00340 [Thermodesulfobacteriota bacterium]|nr:hypothetical protein [Thermodesulfobacteriota bacterium]